MPRKFFKRITPDYRAVREHKYLQVFGKLLHDPYLFHLNRRSVAGAFAVGLFVAFIPVPFQMVLAATIAIFARVNLALSVLLVWITNPLTIPPMFYTSYKIGAWLLSTEIQQRHFELSFEWLSGTFLDIWQPFLLGCFVAGAVAASVGYLAVRLIWRWRIVRYLQARQRKRRLRELKQ